MTENERFQKLNLPSRPVHIVIDSDTGAEVDDQFAIAYAIRSMEQKELTLEAVYAAPFPYDWNAIDPLKGMEASYKEICHVIDLCHTPLHIPAFRGAERYMKADGPVDSPAVQDLIRRGMARPTDDPLYVLSIGAITNIGSALTLEPRLAEHLVVCFLGGNSLSYPHVKEYNIGQDHEAFNAVVSSGVPFVLFPARPCISHLITTLYELEHYLKGKNPIADYLFSIVQKYSEPYKEGDSAWSKVIWDIVGVAYVKHPDWFVSSLHTYPTVSPDGHWVRDSSRSLIRVIDFVERDPIFTDLFRRLG